RDEGPATAAHGADLVVRIELVDLLTITLPVAAAALLNLFDLAVEQIHLDHALLALQRQGEEDDLHHQGKDDQGNAVAIKDPTEGLQQPAKGRHEDLPD